MNDIKMYNGCSACGGCDLSVTTRGTYIEITCSRCGHIEEVINSRVPACSLRSRAALVNTLGAEDRGDEELWE